MAASHPSPRILVTRAPHQASPLADALRTLGCEPILIPTIEIAPPSSFAALDATLTNLDSFHWLLFTSANAVEAFARRASRISQESVILSEAPQRSAGAQPKDPPLRPHPELPPAPSRHKIAAIGPATARALEASGFHVNLTPPQAVAESFATALLPHAVQPDGTPTRFLLIRAESARDHLPDALRAAGAEVTIAPAYRTVIPESSIARLQQLFREPANYPDAITFTSSSTAANFFALLDAAGLALPAEIIRASIGPITSQTLRDAGLPPHVEASEATVQSLAQALAAYLQPR